MSSLESPDAMKARHAAADAAAAARTAAEVARLTAAGLAGHHDGLALVKREATAQLRAACRTADRAKGDAAVATLSAVHKLEPHSLRLGVASRWEWRARSRRVRLLARLGLAFLPTLTREIDPYKMAVDVFAGRLTFATLGEDPLLACSPAWTQPNFVRLSSGEVTHVCGARSLRVRSDVPNDEFERLLAWAVASVAIEAVRGRVWCTGPTLEHDAAELLAAKLVARCARRSEARPVTSSGSSTPGTTTATGGRPRGARSPVVRRHGGRGPLAPSTGGGRGACSGAWRVRSPRGSVGAS